MKNPGMWLLLITPALKRQREVESWESVANLPYLISSKPIKDLAPKQQHKWCLRYALVYIQTHTYTPHTYMCTHRDTHRLFLRPLFISGASNLIGIQNA